QRQQNHAPVRVSAFPRSGGFSGHAPQSLSRFHSYSGCYFFKAPRITTTVEHPPDRCKLAGRRTERKLASLHESRLRVKVARTVKKPRRTRKTAAWRPLMWLSSAFAWFGLLTLQTVAQPSATNAAAYTFTTLAGYAGIGSADGV